VSNNTGKPRTFVSTDLTLEISRSLSEKDTSPALSVSIKEGKYMLYQKLHATQQQQGESAPNDVNKQSEQSDDNSNPAASNESNGSLPNNTANATHQKKPTTTILALPTEIRLMIYAYLFTSLTENTLSRAHTYPLPPLLRTNRVFRNESLQEWGLHLEKVIAQHKEVQNRNVVERKVLQQRDRIMNVYRSGNAIKMQALIEANKGQSSAVLKRVDKLRLLESHQLLAESGGWLADGGSGARWRDGRV
jgi:hypothetical protein